MSDEDLRASVSRLLRGLNHDLKNPLGAADGYLDLLLQGFRGDLSDDQRQTLERVRTLIASGIDILEDVVTYARASIGELRVHAIDTDVKAVVRMTLERHAARVRDAGVELVVDVPDAPVRVSTDGTVLERIVDRLLDNALDHTPEDGRIEVGVRPEGSGAAVQVSDSGAGVPPEDRERVFLAFERGAQPVRPRASAGIGLGLALARALAQQLGGSLTIDGPSTFVLRLP